MLAEQIKECIACEREFKGSDALLAGVSIINCEQYCSPQCELDFEQYLESEVALATERGLTSAEPKLTEADARRIIGNFHLKLTQEKGK
jgi:hypothetical protein